MSILLNTVDNAAATHPRHAAESSKTPWPRPPTTIVQVGMLRSSETFLRGALLAHTPELDVTVTGAPRILESPLLRLVQKQHARVW